MDHLSFLIHYYYFLKLLLPTQLPKITQLANMVFVQIKVIPNFWIAVGGKILTVLKYINDKQGQNNTELF